VAHIACLTFDFDVVSSWIWRDQVTPTALSRGEFGLVGARRILDLLGGEGIATTWFIPGHTIESFPLDCRAVVEAGHEVGHHGYLHEPPAELGSRKAEAAVPAKLGSRLVDKLGVSIRAIAGHSTKCLHE